MKPKTNNLLLIIITIVFTVLLTISLFLLNLRFIIEPHFIKKQFREANVYQSIISELHQSLINNLNLGSNTGSLATNEIKEKLEQSFQPKWLQGEIERNLDEVNSYVVGDKTELTLNLNLHPVKEQIIEQFQMETDEQSLELIEQNIPDKIDFFGTKGLFYEAGAKQLYQLKTTWEAINHLLKILGFLVLFTLASFFLLRPTTTAWRWTGLSLLSAGSVILFWVFALRIIVASRIAPFLNQKLEFGSAMMEVTLNLVNVSLQTYLSLIQWQSIFILLSGLLILMLSMILTLKK